jgi:hypothetical protein
MKSWVQSQLNWREVRCETRVIGARLSSEFLRGFLIYDYFINAADDATLTDHPCSRVGRHP